MWGPDRTKGKLEELKDKAKRAAERITEDQRADGEDEAFHGRAEQASRDNRDHRGDASNVSLGRDGTKE
jgi:hypothetical protein